MPGQTPNYFWQTPDLGGSPNTWGAILNGTIGSIDAQVKKNEAGSVPIGALTMWAGAAAPANWLICDGSSISRTTYPDLFNAIGTVFNSAATGDAFNLPNLQHRLPLGATVGGNPLGVSGGSGVNQGFTYNITAANLPSHVHPIDSTITHNHTITAGSTSHSHSITDPTHTHTEAAHSHGANLVRQGAGSATLSSGGAVQIASFGNTDTATATINANSTGITGTNAATVPAPTIQAATTGISTTQANTGGGTAMSIIPPYLALNFIIKAL